MSISSMNFGVKCYEIIQILGLVWHNEFMNISPSVYIELYMLSIMAITAHVISYMQVLRW